MNTTLESLKSFISMMNTTSESLKVFNNMMNTKSDSLKSKKIFLISRFFLVLRAV